MNPRPLSRLAFLVSWLCFGFFTAVSANATVATPELHPVGGSFYTRNPVEITCATAGAVIHYTLDGSIPTATDPVVASGGTVLVGRALTLKARAELSSEWSEVASGSYRVTGQVVAGSAHALALHFEGTKVWGWGANGSSQLGDGTTTDRSAPVRVQEDAVPTYLGDVIAIGAGGAHSLALLEDQSVVAWGDNAFGQLGDGTTTLRAFPVAVSTLPSIANLAAGKEHSIALAEDGRVLAWGRNSSGQIGLGNTTSPQTSPAYVQTSASVDLAAIAAVTAGGDFSLAVDSAGDVWSWGGNSVGQLADGTTTDRTRAIQSSLSNVSQVAAGLNFGVALKTDGTLLAWGGNADGQLGHGVTSASETVPVAVFRVNEGSETGDQSLTNVTAVAAGESHALALASDGKVWAWGKNTSGQLGDATTTAQYKAVRVQISGGGDLDHVVAIACGADFSIALKDDGTVLTWGSPSSGRLGNGQTSGAFLTAATHANLPKTAYQSPSVILNSPVAGTYIAPANFTLEAGVTIASGAPDALSFLINGAPLAGTLTTSSAPGFEFETAWNNVTVGNYTLKARLFDSYGGMTDSAGVAVNVVPPAISITATVANVNEGSGSPAQFTVSRNVGAPTTLALTINYTVAGTATAGVDYTALTGTVVIPATQTSATIDVAALTDSVVEPSETVIVTLTDGGNDYGVGTSNATIMLAENLPLTSNLRLQLRADGGVTIDGNGKVSNWADQSGLGNSASQTSGTIRPERVASAVNGFPAIRFNGTNQYLNLPNLMSGATAGELFVVIKAAADMPTTPAKGFMRFGSHSGDPYYPHADGKIYDGFGSTVHAAVGNPHRPLNQFHLYNASSKAAEWIARVNGLELSKRTTNVVGFTATPFIGRGPDGSYYFDGDIAEVIVFDQVLTAGERSAVEGYLGGKYALVAAPTDPVNLTATGLSPTQVSLAWQYELGNAVTTFSIERRTGAGAFVEVASVTRAQAWIDTTAVAGTTYEYRVKARNWHGESGYSNVASATTAVDGTSVPLDAKLWLKADSGTTSPDVSHWLDQSGVNNHALQNTAAVRPQLVGNVVNGRPVIRFNGTNQYLNLPNLMNGATAGELFVVLKAAVDVPTTPAQGFMRFGSHSTGSYYAHADGMIYDGFGSTVHAAVGNPSQPLNQFHLYNASSKAAEWIARVNGLELSKRTTNVVGFTAEPLIGRGLDIYYFFDGDIAEIIVFDRVLSSSERSAVEGYLGGKYALVGAPVDPVGLTATALSPTQVSVAWQYELGNAATAFNVERRTGAGAFAEVAIVNHAQAWIDTTAVAGTTYEYRVKARNWHGESGYSNVASATTAVDGTSVPLDAKLWLKADSGTTSPAVSRWLDQSGLGNHAYRETETAKPLLIQNALNGRPAVRFNGTNQSLNLPNLMAGATSGELFVVLKAAADVPTTPAKGFMRFGSHSGDPYYPHADGMIYDGFGTTVHAAVGNPSQPLNQFHLYNASSKAAEWIARVNGLELSKRTTNVVGFTATPLIGRGPDGYYFFDGDIAEVIVFDRVLSTGERGALEKYLGGKYALVSAPASPLNLTVTALSPTQVSVAWQYELGNALTTFSVERRTGAGAFSEVAVVSHAQAWIDTTVAAGTTYEYRVKARNWHGESGYSDVASTTTGTTGVAMPLNPRLWLKADSGSTGPAVSRWLDQSGLGNHAYRETETAKPLLIQNALNGRPVVRFDGLTQFLYLPNLMSGATAGELFVVLKATQDVPTQGRGFLKFGSSSDVTHYPFSDGKIYDDFGRTTRADLGNPVQPLDQFHVYNASSKAAEWIVRLNELSIYKTTTNAVGFTTTPRIGNGGGGATSFAGDIAEILVFDRVLTEDERRLVGTYLNGKYAFNPAPPPPSNLQASVISSTQAVIRWTLPVASVPWLSLERKEASGAFEQIALLEGNRTAYTDGGLTPGQSYTYRLRALQLGLQSTYTPEAQVNLPDGLLTLPTASLLTWLKADEGVLKDSTDAVHQWSNRIEPGGHATQTGASQKPIWVDKQLNGRPVIRFNGSSSFFSLPSDFTDFSAGFTAFVVAKPGNPANQQRLIELGNGNSGNKIVLGRYQATTTLRYEAFNGTTPVTMLESAGAIVQNQWQLFAAINSPTLGELVRNGTTLVQNGGGAIPTIARTSNFIGKGTNFEALFEGDIAEIMIYNRALSEVERGDVEQYLSAKYHLGLLETDTDMDGWGDWTEFLQGTEILEPNTDDDLDQDGLAYWDEFILGTDPFRADTDGDGVVDGLDAYPLDPAQSSPPGSDTVPPIITLTNPPLGPL